MSLKVEIDIHRETLKIEYEGKARNFQNALSWYAFRNPSLIPFLLREETDNANNKGNACNAESNTAEPTALTGKQGRMDVVGKRSGCGLFGFFKKNTKTHF